MSAADDVHGPRGGCRQPAWYGCRGSGRSEPGPLLRLRCARTRKGSDARSCHWTEQGLQRRPKHAENDRCVISCPGRRAVCRWCPGGGCSCGCRGPRRAVPLQRGLRGRRGSRALLDQLREEVHGELQRGDRREGTQREALLQARCHLQREFALPVACPCRSPGTGEWRVRVFRTHAHRRGHDGQGRSGPELPVPSDSPQRLYRSLRLLRLHDGQVAVCDQRLRRPGEADGRLRDADVRGRSWGRKRGRVPGEDHLRPARRRRAACCALRGRLGAAGHCAHGGGVPRGDGRSLGAGHRTVPHHDRDLGRGVGDGEQGAGGARRAVAAGGGHASRDGREGGGDPGEGRRRQDRGCRRQEGAARNRPPREATGPAIVHQGRVGCRDRGTQRARLHCPGDDFGDGPARGQVRSRRTGLRDFSDRRPRRVRAR